MLPTFSAGKPPRAKPRIRLKRIDQLEEVVAADDAFELEARAVVASPDDVRLDAADDGKPDYDAFAPAEAEIALGHEALRGNVDDPHVDVAQLAVLADHHVIDGMPRRAAHVGYG